MSCWVTWINLGWSDAFLWQWLEAFIMAWPAAGLIAFFTAPEIQKITLRILNRGKSV